MHKIFTIISQDIINGILTGIQFASMGSVMGVIIGMIQPELPTPIADGIFLGWFVGSGFYSVTFFTLYSGIYFKRCIL